MLEFTVVGTGWTFQIPFGFFGVIWALGACMVILAAIVRLPIRWIAGLSIGMIVTHNLLDPLRPRQFGSLPGFGTCCTRAAAFSCRSASGSSCCFL